MRDAKVEVAEVDRAANAVALIPKCALPAEPSWERARDLIGEVRQTVRAIVLLGLEIQALREQWFDQGGETRFGDGSTRDSHGRVISTGSPHPAANRSEKGWQAKVREELGISDDTARRLIEKAHYVTMLEEVTRGEAVEYQDTRNRVIEITPTDEMKQMAFGFLEDVIAGTVNAKRAWAGLIGEGSRRAKGGGAGRAAVDYRKSARPCAVTLKGTFQEWARLDWTEDTKDGEEQRAVEAVKEMLRALPETFRAAMAEIIVTEWPENERTALEADLASVGMRRGRKGRA